MDNYNVGNRKEIFGELKDKIEDIGQMFDEYSNDIVSSCITDKTYKLREAINDYNKLKYNFKEEYYYKCRWFCCCCNNECYWCYCCCLKSQYKNKKDIKDKIGDIEDVEKKNIDSKIDLIMKNQKDNIDKKILSSKSKLFYFIFFFFNLFHFFALLELYSFKFALFREIKKSLYRYIKEKYDENEKKTFDDYFRYSILRDISQNNISYFFSCLTPILVNICGI